MSKEQQHPEMGFNVDDFFKELDGGQVLLLYKGSITTEIINHALDVVEGKLQEYNEDAKLRKKVYNVLVESLQNLYHHIDDLPEDYRDEYESRYGVLVVSRVDDSYKIATGNFIRSEKIKYLKDKIDKINSLSREELKDMYKFILNHQKISDKGGGGLGLVDIARKTGNKLNYVFHNFNNDYYFFNLDVFVSEKS
ncbi:MAG: SiaB family protein kinase [Bacteroidales bacterium]